MTSTDKSICSIIDLKLFLEGGITPSDDFTGGYVTYVIDVIDVIENSTARYSIKDSTSIAHILLSETNKP